MKQLYLNDLNTKLYFLHLNIYTIYLLNLDIIASIELVSFIIVDSSMSLNFLSIATFRSGLLLYCLLLT